MSSKAKHPIINKDNLNIPKCPFKPMPCMIPENFDDILHGLKQKEFKFLLRTLNVINLLVFINHNLIDDYDLR